MAELSDINDAAQLAIAIRDEVVRWPGIESGARQIGTPERSAVDFWTEDGRLFVVVVECMPLNEDARHIAIPQQGSNACVCGELMKDVTVHRAELRGVRGSGDDTVTDRLRGVEQVGQPDPPTPIPIDEATPLVLPKPVPVACEGGGLRPLDGGRCQVCGVVPFMITNNEMPAHNRRHFPDAELEAIVRDLAASEPLVTKGEPVHGEWEQCGVCGAVNRWVGDNVKHDMSCVWWNAAAWVLDHPVSGTDQP